MPKFYSQQFLPEYTKDWYNSSLPVGNNTVTKSVRKAEKIGPGSFTDTAKHRLNDLLTRFTGVGSGEVTPYESAADSLTAVGMGMEIPKSKMWYHGTSQPFKKFNPRYNDPSDLFGRMTHVAEDPNYAAEYSGLDSWQNPELVDNMLDYWQSVGYRQPQSHIIPARARVKNAVRVNSNDPNKIDWNDIEDVSRYIADKKNWDSQQRSISLDEIKKLPERMEALGGANFRPTERQIAGHGTAPNRVPRNYLESLLAEDPLALSRTGKDGILYSDNVASSHSKGANVLAVENPAQLVSPYSGELLGLNVKPENLSRIATGRNANIEPKIPYRSHGAKEFSNVRDWLKGHVGVTENHPNFEKTLHLPWEALQDLTDSGVFMDDFSKGRAGKLTDRFVRRGRYSGRDYMGNPESNLKDTQLFNQIWNQHVK